MTSLNDHFATLAPRRRFRPSYRRARLEGDAARRMV